MISEPAERDRVAAIYDEIAPTWDARQGLVECVLMGGAMRRALADALRGDVLDVPVVLVRMDADGAGVRGRDVRHGDDKPLPRSVTATRLRASY
jgi:hypothetical protein